MISLRPDEPIYVQIARVLRDDIQAGRLRPGQSIPSERHLAGQFGVARETAKRAHDLLRAEGLLVRPRGQALVVRELPEMQDLVPPAGATVTARAATQQERHDLGIADGVPLLVITVPGHKDRLYAADRWRLRWPNREAT